MKKPSGDVSTPDTDPDDWEKLKKGNGYKHKKTNWTAKKAPHMVANIGMFRLRTAEDMLMLHLKAK